MRVEEKLLLHCAYPNTDHGKEDRIKFLLQNGIDWSYLIKTTNVHGLIPLLYKSLSAIHSDDIPQWVLEKLHRHFLVNACRNILLTEELFRLLSLFKDKGIPAIPYKGPTLAVLAYGNISLRQFGDLDILIQDQDFQKAKNILISLGYEPEIELSPSREKAFIKSQRDFKFSNKTMMVNLELQWRITPVSFPFSIDSDSLWQRLYPVQIENRETQTFGPEDLILILCVHGLYHSWERLEWVCDLAQLVFRYKHIRWRCVLENARGLGAERLVLFGVFLANDLFQVGLPKEILERLENDQTLKSLLIQRTEKLFDREINFQKIFQYSVFQLKMWKGIRDKVRHCFRLAIIPNVKDAMFLPLPAFLFPLYSLVRPVRLTAEYGMGLLHSMNHKHTQMKNGRSSFTN